MEKAQILIVEDDRIVAEDIQEALRHLGFTVSIYIWPRYLEHNAHLSNL